MKDPLTAPRTLFEKVWDAHVIQQLGDGWCLLHIDRQLLHDMSGSRSLGELEARKLPTPNPELAFATPDHTVPTAVGREAVETPLRSRLASSSARHGIRFFDLGQPGQGIVHVMGPELGIVLPGTTVICGDSHTCTNGALGAMAFGVGSSELMHALATQTLMQRKPRLMRILFDGVLQPRVSAKDVILHAIGQLGASAGTGYAVEYAGKAVHAMSVEERMTLCNLSIEMGAKVGMVAPDDKVIDYLRGRTFAPKDDRFDEAVAHWTALRGDPQARFDREESFDVSTLVPQITWGTSPEQVAGIDGHVPGDDEAPDAARRDAWRDARGYMGLAHGSPLVGMKVDCVFIGSCTNSRLTDLRAAAALLHPGRRVAPHVKAWVVPGSEEVRRAAESEGLHEVFREAGFDWRLPGCSMCVAANGEVAAAGERIVSTSNRNFVGRQGPGARTHLASPVTAVVSALAGEIADPRLS